MADRLNPGNPSGDNSRQQSNSEERNTTIQDTSDVVCWITELAIVLSTLLYLLPIIGSDAYMFYYGALSVNAAKTQLALFKQLLRNNFNLQALKCLLLEDNCHYLLFSVMFNKSSPVTMVLIPVFLIAVTELCDYTSNIISKHRLESLYFVRPFIQLVQKQRIFILRSVAATEIFIIAVVIFMTSIGKSSMFMPILYYIFLCMRYASRKNSVCRTVFSEMKFLVLYMCDISRCPEFVRTLCLKCIGLVSYMAPSVVR